VRGNENVLGLETLGARTFKTNGVPVVDDGHIFARHQEEMRAVEIVAPDDVTAADDPLGMINARRKAGPAGKTKAPFHGMGPAHRIEGRRNMGRVIGTPDVFLGLGGKGRNHLRMIRHDARDPGLGAVGGGQNLRDLAQDVPAQFKPAETPWLGKADQPRRVVILHRRIRHPAQPARLLGAVVQTRRKLPGAVQDLGGGG
jgi:hypothetical protein